MQAILLAGAVFLVLAGLVISIISLFVPVVLAWGLNVGQGLMVMLGGLLLLAAVALLRLLGQVTAALQQLRQELRNLADSLPSALSAMELSARDVPPPAASDDRPAPAPAQDNAKAAPAPSDVTGQDAPSMPQAAQARRQEHTEAAISSPPAPPPEPQAEPEAASAANSSATEETTKPAAPRPDETGPEAATHHDEPDNPAKPDTKTDAETATETDAGTVAEEAPSQQPSPQPDAEPATFAASASPAGKPDAAPETTTPADDQETTRQMLEDAPAQPPLYIVEERIVRGRPARLLSDGTIEAQLEEGWLRFENMEHLDEYLDALEELRSKGMV